LKIRDIFAVYVTISSESQQMTATSAVATTHQSADRPPSRGGILDGRTQTARRRREMIDVYTAALGGPAALSEGQQIDIRKAAELTALAEQARARAMREGFADAGELSAMVRLESTAARAVRALNIRSGANEPKPPSIAEYAARKAAEKAAHRPAGDPA
jgi:hypothetical protein